MLLESRKETLQKLIQRSNVLRNKINNTTDMKIKRLLERTYKNTVNLLNSVFKGEIVY